MLKMKAGDTLVLALKQLESEVVWTVAATLVPPVPKPFASLTYEKTS
jgi:hypothetical protein